MDGNQIGTIVGVAFGCAWGIAGGLSLSRQWRTVTVSGSILISVVLAILIYRSPSRVHAPFDGAIYGMAVSAEVIAILATIAVLTRMGKSGFIPSAVATIVGLHFLGLWKATEDATFIWLAGALCLVGAVSASLKSPLRMPVTGLASAIALWAAASSTLMPN